jgi:hypothetical protein
MNHSALIRDLLEESRNNGLCGKTCSRTEAGIEP